MNSKILEKLNQKSTNLIEEVKALRSFLIGILGRDKEGEYKPEFVRKVLRAARKKAVFTFKGRKDFLEQIKKK
jgi:hypothetical protein